MTIVIESAYSDAEHDEWLRLFANRDEVAAEYATLLRANCPGWPGWRQINEAIMRRWSMSGLRYIKTTAWKIAEADRPSLKPCVYCGLPTKRRDEGMPVCRGHADLPAIEKGCE